MENEKTLLGQLLIDNTVFHSLEITEEDFQTVDTKRVFRAIKTCIDAGRVADLITVIDTDVNIGHSFLAGLTSNTPTAANWKFYHDRIKNASYRAKLKNLSANMKDWVNSLSPDDTVKNIEEALMEITKKTGKSKVMKISEVAPKFIQTVEDRYNNKGEALGIQTGIKKLDDMIIGFRDRLFYLIGARPSHGKSALLLNFACHAGIRLDKKVGYISTESSIQEVITRLFASEGKINSMNLITGYIKPKDFTGMTDVACKIYEKNMYFYYTPGMSIDNLSQTARLMVRYYGCEIIYVDYLQDILVSGPGTTIEKTSRKSKTMKYLAEELNIPIVAAAQLRRDADERRPRLSDFGDSSQLEKDADGALLIYHHNITKEKGETPVYKSYILAEKVRDGITGDIPVQFTKEYVTFNERIGDA